MLGDAQFVPIKFVVSIDLLLFRVCLSEYFIITSSNFIQDGTTLFVQ